MQTESRGPEVAAHEELLRAITCLSWWVSAEKRVSSAAFTVTSPFSVHVRSLTTDSEFLGKFAEGAGAVMFICGPARAIGFDTRHESDEYDPDDRAHAHVYYDPNQGKRKTNAKKLALMTIAIKEPTAPE